MSALFYKMDLHPEEDGLNIYTHQFTSIHETPCFHFCVRTNELSYVKCWLQEGEALLQCAKRKGNKIFRIDKKNSRIAFDTEQKAFENLQYRKQLQLRHMRRELEFCKEFLSKTEGKKFSDFSGPIPETQDLVLEYLRFD